MHQDSPLVTDIAKATICHLIAKHENTTSSLRHPMSWQRKPKPPNFDEKWLQEFAHICFTQTPKTKITESLSRVKIVSFNYDRCLAQFTRVAIKLLYSLPDNEAAELSSALSITHAYGSLGSLDASAPNYFDFGASTMRKIPEIYKRIKTFTEGNIEGGTLAAIKSQVAECERIVLLGFGFHGQNIEILKNDPSLSNKDKVIIGTSLGIAEAAQKDLEFKLAKAFRGGTGTRARVILEPKGCRQLLEEYRHSLLA